MTLPHSAAPAIRRKKCSIHMSIPFAMLFGAAGLALAVLSGMVLYKSDAKKIREEGESLSLQKE